MAGVLDTYKIITTTTWPWLQKNGMTYGWG